MKRIAVNSSAIKSIGFYNDSDPGFVVLEIEFKNNSIYSYTDIPIHVVQEFLEADSIAEASFAEACLERDAEVEEGISRAVVKAARKVFQQDPL